MYLLRVAALLVPAIVAVTITQDSVTQTGAALVPTPPSHAGRMAYRGNDGNITLGAGDGGVPAELTSDGNNTSSALSSDGEWIAYIEDGLTVWMVRPDGSDRRLILERADGPLISPYTQLSNLRWTKDPCVLSYVAYYGSVSGHVIRAFSICDSTTSDGGGYSDGDDPGLYSTEGFDVSVIDGAIINGFQGAGADECHLQIWKDGITEQETVFDQGECGKSPVWSPDGTKIAFAFWRAPGDSAIYTLNRDGTGLRQLTFPPPAAGGYGLAHDYSPDWSPDGSRIAFMRNYGQEGIFIVTIRADGTDEREITAAFGRSPDWSPDGKRIAFSAGGWVDFESIYTINADGGDWRQLTSGSHDDCCPAWRPMPKPKKIVLFVDGIGSTGSCSDIGPWKSIRDALKSKDLLDDWLRYVYTSESEAVPHCWDANQSGRSWEKKDSCWSLDNKWRDIFFEHNVQGGGEADRLKTFVKAYLDSHSGVDLYIVAHSQGGLISADAVKALNDKRIKSLVTLDSPLQGINSLAGGLIVNTILRFKWGCPFPVDQFDSIDDMVCARFILCADFVKSLKSANPKTRLFTVNERGDGPGVLFEVINDEHSRLPWEQAHIEVTTGDHNKVMNGGGNQDAQGVVRAFIACAIRGTTDPRMCDEDAEGMLSEIFPNGPPATNKYVVGNGASAFQASTEWSVDAGPQQVAATGEPIIVTTLVSPSMRVIDASTVAPDVEHETGPSYESFVVTDPEPGDWTVRLSGVDLPPDGAMVRSFATEVPGSGVDADGDAVRDETDVCPAVYDTSQSDFDGDGTGDACDPDNDNDDILNESDNCEFGPNPDQLDANGNSVGDACDPDLRDLDNDGVLDGADNCFFIPNPTQADTDNDGIGDACVLVIGDTDCDQDVDAVDALNVLRDVAGLPVSAQCLVSSGDIDCDADIDSVDALGILRYVASLPVNQPQGCAAIGSPIVPAQASTGLGADDIWSALLAAVPAFGVIGARPRRAVIRPNIERDRRR